MKITLIFAMSLLWNGLPSPIYAQTHETASVHFSVLKESNGGPVRNAGVVLHPVKKDGKQERGGLELKTDAEGNATYDGVPYGRLRIQVLAPGFQTYGEDFEVNQPSLEITVKLKRPSGQYSIYDEHPEKDKGQTREPDKQPEKQ
ncbi:MAG: hypothetical protein QOD84_2103 [Acidobacteriaceae bacterium]|jgi:hypothetical protein